MPACAFCGSDKESLTREHLFPKGIDALIIRPSEDHHFFSERIPAKFVDGELTVKDVCGSCNNRALSELDAYMTLWVREHARYFSRGESIVVKYEYDKLLRWLLKFAFNHSRVNPDFSGDVGLLKRSRGYILGQAKKPKRVHLWAGLVYSYVPTADELRMFGNDAPIHPDAIRSSIVRTNFKSQYQFSVRRVSLGAFAFLFLIFEPSAPALEVSTLAGLLETHMKGIRLLSVSGTHVKLTASSENTMEAWRDHMQLQAIPYEELLKKFQTRR
jgi:hypothetical protein